MSVKVLVGEQDGVELGVPTEYELSMNDLNPVEYIDFDLTADPGHAEGRLHWDDDAGTLDLDLPGGDVHLQVGQEILLRVKNVEGSTISNGSVVYISGASGGKPEVQLASASGVDGLKSMAVATEDISNNQFGYVNFTGLVRGIDTSFGSEGDEIYLSTTPGELTTNKLDLPDFRIKVGYIINSHATEGSILVQIQDATPASNKKVFYVNMDGDDTTADGSFSLPFASIKAAIAHINATYTLSATENAVIQVAAGEYEENNPIALPRFCSLWGYHYRTRVSAANAGLDLITSLGGHTIRGLLLSGVTGVGKYIIKVEATQSTRITLQDLSFSDYEGAGNISNGVYLSSTTGTVTMRLKQIDFDDITTTCVYLNNNARALFRGNQVFDGCSAATFLSAHNNCSYDLQHIDIDDVDTAINHQCTSPSSINSCDFFNAGIPIKKSNDAVITALNLHMRTQNAQITNFKGIEGFIFDDIEGEDTMRVISEFAVGIPAFGAESCLGEGDSYVLGMKVYTYNGTTFTDETEAARSSSGSTFAMPSTGTEKSIYFTSQVRNVDSGLFVTFLGLKLTKTVAMSSDGEVVAEYWNGSSWVDLNTLVTESSGKYLPMAKELLKTNGSTQVRFNAAIEDDWIKNDPVSQGFDTYWMRLRVTTNPTTYPVFEKIKLHSNRTEINADGFIEYFGRARPLTIVKLGPFSPANKSPLNQDAYLSDNLAVGFVENKFVSGTEDAVGAVVAMPAEVDTSCKATLDLFIANEGTDTDDVQFTIRWASVTDGDSVYFTTSQAPSSYPKEKSITGTVASPGRREQFSISFDLDISEHIARRDANTADSFWINIQRDGNDDTNNGDIILLNAQLRFVKWSQGGHL